MENRSAIYIDVHASRTRVALLQGDELVEFYVERNSRAKTVGSIYRGKVMNVVSGMNAAFVDIGLKKNAYLYVGGGLVDKNELMGDAPHPSGSVLEVHEGDEIMVQVVKDESGTKGARITQDVSVAGRFLVYMPYVDYIGISRKIEDEQLREKLHKQVAALTPLGGGFVVRTAAATASVKEIKQDAKFLIDTFDEIKQKYDASSAPSCAYVDGDLVFRTVRDMYTSQISEIVTNNEACFEYLKDILQKVAPKNKTVVTMYAGSSDMFRRCNLDVKIEALLKRRVPLKNGAYLVIDKTEALTVIDVNTGKYVGSGNDLEETVFTTNMLASREIARQIRLRNIGGIIITDFIDMLDDTHRERVLEELRAELKKDRIKTSLVGMTGLGLVEITRKKTINDAQQLLMQPCPYCNGDGVVCSFEYLTMKIRVELLDAFERGAQSCVVTLHPMAIESILKNKILSRDAETVFKDKLIYIVPNLQLAVDKFEVRAESGDIITLPDSAKLLY